MKLLLTALFLISVSTTIAQSWSQIGPSGGYFKEFTYDPSNASTIYAGSDDGGGIWKSTNGGSDWNLLTADFPNMTGWSITVDPINSNTVYACDVYGRYGLLISTDGGTSWNQSTNGLSTIYDRMVSGIAIKSNDTLFISTGEGANTTPPRPGNGVFKSFDGGTSWTPAGLQGETVYSIGSTVFGTIFVGTEGQGLQFTNDNGSTWLPHPDIASTALVFEIEVEDSVIAVASSSGIFLSTNWGINFTNTGLVGNFNFDVYIQNSGPEIKLLCPTYSGLQQYSSLTTSWNTLSDPLIDTKLTIGIAANNNEILVGTFSNGPIYRSQDDGASWSEINSPICTEINDVEIDPNNPNNIITSLLGTYNVGGIYDDQCLYSSTDGGANWTRKGPKAHGLGVAPNPQNFNSCYLGTFSKGLFKSTDGFNNYTNLISGNKLIADIIVSSEDTNVVIVSELDFDLAQSSIKRSTDGGTSFTNVSGLATNRLAFNSMSNDTVYAATTSGIHISSDNGQTWNPWQVPGENILAITHNGSVYAGTDDGDLYKIDDTGLTTISGPWQLPVQIKSIYKENGHLIVGLNGAEQDTTRVLSGSIWKSSDDGVSWTEITGDMHATNVYGNNVIAGINGELLVGTYGGGIFQSNDLTLSANELSHDSFEIQLFPNPTTNFIAVSTDLAGVFNIEIIDNSGRMVYKTTASNGQKIDIRHLSSGLYGLVIRSENGNASSSFVVR